MIQCGIVSRIVPHNRLIHPRIHLFARGGQRLPQWFVQHRSPVSAFSKAVLSARQSVCAPPLSRPANLALFPLFQLAAIDFHTGKTGFWIASATLGRTGCAAMFPQA